MRWVLGSANAPMLGLLLATPVLALAAQDEHEWIDLFLSGSRALEQGWLDIACSDLESALRILPEHGPTAWQLASAYSCAGERNAAFEWLERAIDWGGGEAALLEWDTDLASLRGNTRYAGLATELRERDAKHGRESIPCELAWRAGGWSISASSSAEIVACGRGGSTFLWDSRTRETTTVLDRPGENIGQVEVSPDGRWVVTSGSAEDRRTGIHFLRVFDASTGDLLRDLGDPGGAAHVRFSRDSERMLSSAEAEGGGSVWETCSWTRVGVVPGAESMEFSPDGRTVLLSSRAERSDEDNTYRYEIALWDVASRRRLARFQDLDSAPSTSLDFSADGALALVRDPNGTMLHILDTRSGEVLRNIEPSGPAIRTACFLGTTGELATMDQEFLVQIWSSRSGDALRRFRLAGDSWLRLEASPDGRLLIATRDFRTHEVLDAQSGSLMWSCGPEADDIAVMRFSPDGTRLLTMGLDKRMSVRDASSGEVQASLHGPGLGSNAIAHPKQNEFWVSASDGSLRRIDARSGRALDAWELGGAADQGLFFSRNGERLAALDRDRTLRVIDSATGSVLAAIPEAWPEGHGSYLGQFEFATDRSLLAVAGYDPRVMLYFAPDWTLACTLDPGPGRGPIALRPDGQWLAVGAAQGRVLFFDTRSGERVAGELAIEGRIEALAFEPGGSRLWVGSNQSKVHVFDVASGALVRTLDLADLDALDSVELGNIAYDRRGKLAVTTSSGYGVVAAWRVDSGERIWDYHYDGGNPGALACAFGANGERVYVWGQTEETQRIVDATSGNTLLDLGTGAKWSLLPLPNEELVGVECDEGLEVIETLGGSRRWSRIELESGGWLLRSASRYVDGTREALETLHLVLPERSYPLDALAAALLDPKRVRAAAEGVAIAPAEILPIPTLLWASPQPRVLTVDPSAPAPTITLEAACPDGLAGFEWMRNGERSRLAGEAIDATHRRLVMTLDAPKKGESVNLRWRAISSRGILSRALHLSIEPTPETSGR